MAATLVLTGEVDRTRLSTAVTSVALGVNCIVWPVRWGCLVRTSSPRLGVSLVGCRTAHSCCDTTSVDAAASGRVYVSLTLSSKAVLTAAMEEVKSEDSIEEHSVIRVGRFVI